MEKLRTHFSPRTREGDTRAAGAGRILLRPSGKRGRGVGDTMPVGMGDVMPSGGIEGRACLQGEGNSYRRPSKKLQENCRKLENGYKN